MIVMNLKESSVTFSWQPFHTERDSDAKADWGMIAAYL